MVDRRIENLYKEFKANQQIFRVLEASKALTEGVFDELPVALIMIDQWHRILKLNHAAEVIFRSPEQSVLGEKLQNLWPEDQAEGLGECLEVVKSNPKEVQRGFEQAIEAQDGTRYLYWQVCPVYVDSAGGRVFALLGNDITDARTALALSKDLEVAKAVQKMLIPDQSDIASDHCKINVYYEPAAQVSGDLWWCRSFDDYTLTVLIDVMGHGAGSAMVTAIVVGALESYASTMSPTDPEAPEKMFEHIHDVVCKACRGETMVACAAVVAKKDAPQYRLYGMGFPTAVIMAPDGSSKNIAARGTPMGFPDMPFEVGKTDFDLQANEHFVLFTDGAYEFHVEDRTQLGRVKFIKEAARLFEPSGHKFRDKVAEKLRELRAEPLPEDDITLAIFSPS